MGIQEELFKSYKEEGIEIGYKRGIEEGIKLVLDIINMLKKGKSVTEILKELDTTKKVVLRVKQTFEE